MKRVLFYFLILTQLANSQKLCNDFNNNCQPVDDKNYYYYQIEINDCSSFKFDDVVQREIKEGLINKIISKVELKSTLEISNIDGESSSKFSEKTSIQSSGILFDLNYIKCNKSGNNLFIAYVEKDIFNESSKRSFENNLLSLNSEIDLIFDQLILNNEILFENEISKIKSEIEFMDKNMLFLSNIKISYDLVYAFNSLKSKFSLLNSKIKSFDNLRNEIMNYILNSNYERAMIEYKVINAKFGKEDRYKDQIKELRKLIRRLK
mgnify:CR=1 FL=1